MCLYLPLTQKTVKPKTPSFFHFDTVGRLLQGFQFFRFLAELIVAVPLFQAGCRPKNAAFDTLRQFPYTLPAACGYLPIET